LSDLQGSATVNKQERFQAFIENCSEAFWCVELVRPMPTELDTLSKIGWAYEHGIMAEANDAMARMYGIPSGSELVGAHLQDLLPREVNEDYLRSFFESGYRLTDVESQERDVMGRTKYFLNNLIGIVENGALLRVWGTQRDITERKQLEGQLRQAQKMEAVGRLAGGVAHDFNNILSAILTYATLLEAEPGLGADVLDGLQQIRAAAERGAGLTKPLLAFSRQQVVRVRQLDANKVVRGVEKMLHRLVGDDIEIVTRLAPGLYPIQADAGAIEQVLLNLVVNARDAMPTGGRVTIETANVELDENYVSGHFGSTPGPHVMLAVSDGGVGMDEATQARIFEPFFTTKPVGEGTGLGLSIVYGLVKQSRGNVFVYSEPGRGTSFKIYLPQDLSAREAAPAAVERPRPACAGSEVVLLVDDDPLVRGAARAILDRFGYAVLEAEDGEVALSLGQARAGAIHLLLADVVMPRLGGSELARRLGAARPDMRVLFMSGYTDDIALQHGVREGDVAYLQKPFTPESLAVAVRASLDGPPVQRRAG
jgi:two-component system cell cycle sensor histidine kinase/response regulator CckA